LFNKKDKTKIVNIIILIQYDSKNNIKKNILNDFKQLHYLIFLCGSEINLVFVTDFDTEITKLIFSNNLIICDDSYDILKPIKKVNERYLMKKLLNKKK